MRTREELAWAGGFYSGEGHFCTHGQRDRRPVCEAGVTNTDMELLDRFQRALGFGAVRLTRKAGKTDSRGVTATKDCFKWTATSFENFQATGALLWPWLGREKRNKFVAVLAVAREAQVWMKHRTKCPQGHPYDEQNTLVVVKKGTGKRLRQCRECNRRRDRERRARRKVAECH